MTNKKNRFSPYRAAGQFGLGASRADLAAIGSDPVGWVLDQLDSKASNILEGLPTAASSIAERATYRQTQQRMRRQAEGQDAALRELREYQREFRRESQSSIARNLALRLSHGMTTPLPVKERLTLFWSNHFTVSRAGRPNIASACCAFENEAIRPTVDGFMFDMLLAATSHPVMLLYLDNARSVGPRSTAGRRQDRGLNENLAREILELHTLGVDGGYSQEDVTSLARILTGWTVGGARLRRFGVEAGEAAYVDFMHEPGSQVVLGKRYPAGGREQAVDCLRDLSVHPATARHVATKLVRHFTTDEPAPRDVDHIARIYMDSHGHLPTVHRALLTLSSTWQEANRKLKTPWELVLSTGRGLALNDGYSRDAARALRLMNHLPFTAPSPAGWPDAIEHWGAPAALKLRIQWALAVGQRLGNRIDARDAARVLVDPTRHRELMGAVARAESPAQALGLLLSSPTFQWRCA